MKKYLFSIVSVLFMLFVVATSADAATYYVATTGSDTNPGTISQPFQTIQKAANVVNAGDMVIVEDGNYTDTSPPSAYNTFVNITRGGTSSNWVTFKARNTGGAKILGTSYHGIRVGAPYVRVLKICGAFDNMLS